LEPLPAWPADAARARTHTQHLAAAALAQDPARLAPVSIAYIVNGLARRSGPSIAPALEKKPLC
jgi:hypothetical protein